VTTNATVSPPLLSLTQARDADALNTGLGGEQISLAVKSKISDKFGKAGYTDIHTNATFVGGSVRQYGNFSFSRVYNAGHEGRFFCSL
jgi:hypothetical protein